MKPVAAAVSAVNEVSVPGGLKGTCCQVTPPSADSSAIVPAPGAVRVAEPTAGPFPVVPWPSATTRLPSAATCWSAPTEAPEGGGMTIVFQERPSVVTHEAGWPLCEPTETNPCAVAATASIWLEPVARFTSCARVQLVMFGDPQTSAAFEVSTTGPGAPTASQPAGPCVTLVSARRWGSAATSPREETRVQAPPEVRRHTAG